MTSVYRREIDELHAFFVAWFRGELPRTPENFARFTNVTSPEFTLISPDGSMIDYSGAADWIENAYGSRTNFNILIENFRLHQKQDGVAIVSYHEWGESDAGVTSRISTAVFADDASTPNGVRWLHVHETWLKDSA